MRVCANPECQLEFVPKTHNQKYHSDECCKIVTNKRIMEKYYENKERRSRPRKCQVCGTSLSRYNDDEEDLCQPHKESGGMTRSELLGLIGHEYSKSD